MKSVILKVIADGRVTLPKELREQADIKEGDFIEIQVLRKINTKET